MNKEEIAGTASDWPCDEFFLSHGDTRDSRRPGPARRGRQAPWSITDGVGLVVSVYTKTRAT